MAAPLPYTPEFMEKAHAFLHGFYRRHGNNFAMPDFLRELGAAGIALVDPARSTFLIDQNVYEGVCFRLQRERRVRPPHRIVTVEIWRSLKA